VYLVRDESGVVVDAGIDEFVELERMTPRYLRGSRRDEARHPEDRVRLAHHDPRTGEEGLDRGGCLMPCSPLLVDVEDSVEVLRIIRANPILCCSEPSQTFYPLEARGWVTYREGRWWLTEEGLHASESENPEPSTKTLLEEMMGL